MEDISNKQMEIDFVGAAPCGRPGTGDGHGDNTGQAQGPAPTTDLTDLEIKILALIQRGRKNAISMPALANAFGISTRELQSVIQSLINDRGVMIASATGKNHGYFIPETAEEYRAAVDQLKHRIISLARRIRAIDKAAYEEIFGQGNIFQEVK